MFCSGESSIGTANAASVVHDLDALLRGLEEMFPRNGIERN